MKQFATRVECPTVLIDTATLVKSKRRVSNLIRKYRKQIRISDDAKYIDGKCKKIVLLKLILKTYTQLLDE